jgi:hypothetical protein
LSGSAALLALAVGVIALMAGTKPADGNANRVPVSVKTSPTNPVGSVRLRLYSNWTRFTTKDGLPSNKVFCVRVDGNRLWAGTDHGLTLYESNRWRTFTTKDGLPADGVLAVDVSPRTGDVWVATMGGLVRYSAGRFDVFDQLNSGLTNDFVHDVACDPYEDAVWAATAMGVNRYNLRTGAWDAYTDENAPMHEPWTYAVEVGPDKVFVGAWGGGVLEFEKATERWREYKDPDKEFEVDLLPDDGLVHDITSGLAYRDGVMWQATYFGASRYDGRSWKTFFAEDSGLPSNFILFVRSEGRNAWFCTDQGLGNTNGKDWVVYRARDDGKGDVTLREGAKVVVRQTTPTAIAHNFVNGVDVQGDFVWVATSDGISRGHAASRLPDAAKSLAWLTAGREPKRDEMGN